LRQTRNNADDNLSGGLVVYNVIDFFYTVVFDRFDCTEYGHLIKVTGVRMRKPVLLRDKYR